MGRRFGYRVSEVGPMYPCPLCSCHVRRSDAECPHCGTHLQGVTVRSTAAAAILGLAVACIGGDPGTEKGNTVPTSGVDYGGAVSDTDTDVDADTDTDTDADSDTETSGDTGSTTGVDYGSPTSGDTGIRR